MQKSRIFSVFLGLLLPVCSGGMAIFADTPTPAFLINELKKYEENMDGVSADFHCTAQINEGETSKIEYPGSFKYGNGHYWQIVRDWKTPDSAWTELSYIRDQHQISLSKLKDDERVGLSATVKGEGFPPVQNRLVSYPLFGYIEGTRGIVRIRELLDTMLLSVESGGSSQNETVVLNGKSNEADISIWFSQKGYYVPTRILLIPKDHPYLIRCDYQFDDFQMIDGIPFPHKVTTSREQFYLIPYWGGKDGAMEQRRPKDIPRESADKSRLPKNFDWSKVNEDKLLLTSVHTFSNVRVKQNFTLEDFAITTPIEEERNIIVDNARHLPHVVKEGKPVPLYDPAILEVKGVSFIGSPDSPRFWFNVLAFFLLFLALLHMIYKYFQNRKGGAE